MTKMFNDLNRKLKEHNPNSVLICDLWHEGRDMWKKDEFLPSKDILMVWADYGVADFREWPEEYKGYDFGLYIHAGVWLNHVMQDPFPREIELATKEGLDRKMNNYYLVNGQDFRHFILNIEATAKASFDSEGFDGEKFYKEFVGRYFNKNASTHIISSLKKLHEAHYHKESSVLPRSYAGYKEVTESSRRILDGMARQRPRKLLPLADIEKSLVLLSEAQKDLDRAYSLIADDEKLLFDDQLVFPLRILKENIEFLRLVVVANNERFENKEISVDLVSQLLLQRKLLVEGSKWDKWEGWTHPDNFRVYTPHYKKQELEDLLIRIK